MERWDTPSYFSLGDSAMGPLKKSTPRTSRVCCDDSGEGGYIVGFIVSTRSFILLCRNISRGGFWAK